MDAKTTRELTEAQCGAIYDRLQEMLASLAGYLEIDNLDDYFIPLRQYILKGSGTNGHYEPKEIDMQSAMVQFALSLQNSGHMQRAIGFDEKKHKQAFIDEGILDPENIMANYGRHLGLGDSDRHDKEIANLAHKMGRILGKDGTGAQLRGYARGMVAAARYLTSLDDRGSSALDHINAVIRFNPDCDGGSSSGKWIEPCNAEARRLSSIIYGLGPALSRDFLKECGCVWLAKPDIHVVKVLKGLGVLDKDFSPFLSTHNADEFCELMCDIAVKARRAHAGESGSATITPYKIDKMIWLLCTNKFYLEPKQNIRSHRDAVVRSLSNSMSE